jgi:hypothetical protein
VSAILLLTVVGNKKLTNEEKNARQIRKNEKYKKNLKEGET